MNKGISMNDLSNFSQYHPAWQGEEFNQEQYSQLLTTLASKKEDDRLVADGKSIKIAGRIDKIWQTIRGWLGFENQTDPIKVNYELLKLLQYGEMQHFFDDDTVKDLVGRLQKTLVGDEVYSCEAITTVITTILHTPDDVKIAELTKHTITAFGRENQARLQPARWAHLFSKSLPPAQMHYNEASILISLGKFSEAIPILEAALKLAPNHPEWQLKLCALKVKEGFYSQAISLLKDIPQDYLKGRPILEVYLEFTRKHPELHISSFQQGNLIFNIAGQDSVPEDQKIRLLNAAVERFREAHPGEEALRVSPLLFKAHLMLAKSYEQAQQFDQSQIHLQEASHVLQSLRQQQNTSFFNTNLPLFKAQAESLILELNSDGFHQEVAEILLLLIDLYRGKPESHDLIGRFIQKTEDLETMTKTKEYLGKAYDLDPQYAYLLAWADCCKKEQQGTPEVICEHLVGLAQNRLGGAAHILALYEIALPLANEGQQRAIIAKLLASSKELEEKDIMMSRQYYALAGWYMTKESDRIKLKSAISAPSAPTVDALVAPETQPAAPSGTQPVQPVAQQAAQPVAPPPKTLEQQFQTLMVDALKCAKLGQQDKAIAIYTTLLKPGYLLPPADVKKSEIPDKVRNRLLEDFCKTLLGHADWLLDEGSIEAAQQYFDIIDNNELSDFLSIPLKLQIARMCVKLDTGDPMRNVNAGYWFDQALPKPSEQKIEKRIYDALVEDAEHQKHIGCQKNGPIALTNLERAIEQYQKALPANPNLAQAINETKVLIAEKYQEYGAYDPQSVRESIVGLINEAKKHPEIANVLSPQWFSKLRHSDYKELLDLASVQPNPVDMEKAGERACKLIEEAYRKNKTTMPLAMQQVFNKTQQNLLNMQRYFLGISDAVNRLRNYCRTSQWVDEKFTGDVRPSFMSWVHPGKVNRSSLDPATISDAQTALHLLEPYIQDPNMPSTIYKTIRQLKALLQPGGYLKMAEVLYQDVEASINPNQYAPFMGKRNEMDAQLGDFAYGQAIKDNDKEKQKQHARQAIGYYQKLTPGQDPAIYQPYCERFIDAYILNGEPSKAIALYEKLAPQNAQLKINPQAYVLESHRLFTEGQHEQAFQLISKAIQKFPDNVELKVGKSRLCMRLGDHQFKQNNLQKALLCYTKATQCGAPPDFRNYLKLAQVKIPIVAQAKEIEYALSHLLEAIDMLNQAIELEPNHTKLKDHRAALQFHLGRIAYQNSQLYSSLSPDFQTKLNIRQHLEEAFKWQQTTASPESVDERNTWYLKNKGYAYALMSWCQVLGHDVESPQYQDAKQSFGVSHLQNAEDYWNLPWPVIDEKDFDLEEALV